MIWTAEGWGVGVVLGSVGFMFGVETELRVSNRVRFGRRIEG